MANKWSAVLSDDSGALIPWKSADQRSIVSDIYVSYNAGRTNWTDGHTSDYMIVAINNALSV